MQADAQALISMIASTIINKYHQRHSSSKRIIVVERKGPQIS